ncbi:MAG: rplM [Clostridiales bacterium]|jgi:large subunit ribosomal protein L13|nr:rplM [Clostridiales bacterium]
MKSFMANPQTVERKWYLVDASGQTLGRLASEVAAVLRGKNKPTFTPHVDTGDFVIIINADKVKVTGKKAEQKVYKTYSGYVGGLKEIPYKVMLDTKPEEILHLAIKGMLPKNAIGRQMITKLRVYKGAEHDHIAQQPEVLVFNK